MQKIATEMVRSSGAIRSGGARRRLRSTNVRAEPRPDAGADGRGKHRARSASWRAERSRTGRASMNISTLFHAKLAGRWRTDQHLRPRRSVAVGSAADNALFAEPFVGAGAHAVVLDFINVDQAGGSIVPDVPTSEPCDRRWYGITPSVSVATATSFYVSSPPPARILPAARCREVGANKTCRPTSARARCSSAACTISSRCGCRSARPTSNSPTRWNGPERRRHIDDLTMPLLSSMAPASRRNFNARRGFFCGAQRAGKPAELIVGESYNHFEMFRDDRQSVRPAGRALLQQMGTEVRPQAARRFLIALGLPAWLAVVRINSVPQLRQA